MPQTNFIQAINQAHRRRNGTRSADLPDGRGRGARRVRRDQGPHRQVRRQARAQHADFGGRLRRRGGRRRDGGDAADLRSRIRQLLLLRLRPGLQPGRQAPLHVGRTGDHADNVSRGIRRDGRRGRATFRDRVRAIPERPGAQAGRPFGAVGYEGPAQERDPRQQSRDRFRARRARPTQRGHSRRRAPGAARQSRGEARRRQRDGGRDRRDGAEGDEASRTSSSRKISRSK